MNEYVDCLVDPNDANNYGTHYAKKLNLFCKDCKKIFKQSPRQYSILGHKSCKCRPIYTYPERFIKGLLKNLLSKDLIVYYKIHLRKCAPSKEKLLEQGEPNMDRKYYEYDFIVYLNDLTRIIIEANGMQHYEESTFVTQSLDEIIRNDIVKENIANNIYGFDDDSYIVLDCSESNLIYIRRSIIVSIIPTLIGNECLNVDWQKIHINASKRISAEIVNYYQKHRNTSIMELSNKFSVGEYLVVLYLKDANLYDKLQVYQNAMNYRKRVLADKIKKVCEYYMQVTEDEMNNETIGDIANKFNIGYTTCLGYLKTYGYYNEKREKNVKGFKIAKAKETTWIKYYQCAQEYFREHHTLYVPQKETYLNLYLGKWIQHQREQKKGYLNNPLLQYRIRLLDEIGMHWAKSKK